MEIRMCLSCKWWIGDKKIRPCMHPLMKREMRRPEERCAGWQKRVNLP